MPTVSTKFAEKKPEFQSDINKKLARSWNVFSQYLKFCFGVEG